MNPTRAALLRAVLLAPADDLPRLVLADWLEEHGEGERAEFIRLQVEIERLKARSSVGCSMLPDNTCSAFNAAMRQVNSRVPDGWCVSCRPRVLLLEREQDLFLKITDHFRPPRRKVRWATFLCTIQPQSAGPLSVVSRGFVQTVRGPLARLREHLPTICREHPVERVEVTDKRTHGGIWFGPGFQSTNEDIPDGMESDDLPADLISLMLSETTANSPGYSRYVYCKDDEDAANVLSAALLHEARPLAPETSP